MSEAAFRAIGEPHRREILHLLRGGPRPAGEIAERFDITQQAVSQHLKVLRDAGLVAVSAQGQQRLYAIRLEGLAGLRDFLAEFWPDALTRLKQAVESSDDD
jgi:DNA-binding transcriptional ArsR family regulator